MINLEYDILVIERRTTLYVGEIAATILTKTYRSPLLWDPQLEQLCGHHSVLL